MCKLKKVGKLANKNWGSLSSFKSYLEKKAKKKKKQTNKQTNKQTKKKKAETLVKSNKLFSARSLIANEQWPRTSLIKN